jgi:hypothetical protein
MFILRSASGQTFTNLNFESARIVLDTGSIYYPYAVYATSAVPGWTITGFLGPTELLYNDISLGAPSVSLCSTSPPSLGGRYSINLYGGVPGPPGYPTVGGSMSQTGLVPASAQSLRFIASGGNGPLVLTLGGQNLPFYALSNGPGYVMYGADISAFEGQVEPMTFQTPFNSGINNYWMIDNIQFSPTPIPEPGFAIPIVFGVLIMCGRVTFGRSCHTPPNRASSRDLAHRA